MNRIVVTDSANRYTRISKVEARKIFDAGKSIYVIAHKLRPGFPFSLGMMVDGAAHLEDFKQSYPNGHPSIENFNAFDRMVNSFSFYNCTDHETGIYPAYYLVEEKKAV